ncbi:MAG: GNAT family N-acetyltransferase [Pseudomonadota bacterium]
MQWFENLYTEALLGDVSPRIYVYTGEDCAPLALFCATHAQQPGTLTSLTNFYSLEFGLSGVCRDADYRRKALSEIATQIAGERHAIIDLRLLLNGEVETVDTLNAFTAAGYRCETYFQFENWIRRDSDVGGGSFEDYYASLPSKLRNTVRRKGKRLERDYAVRVEVLREPGEALDVAIRHYVQVYDRSWKEPEPFAGFMPGLIRLAATLGALTLGVLYLDDAPVAAQVWLHEPGRTVIYKLAYDEEFKHTSAGTVLSRALFEDSFMRRDIGVIDYGVGNEAYKRDWMTEKRRMIGVRGSHSGTLKGRVAIAMASVRRLAKKLLGRG